MHGQPISIPRSTSPHAAASAHQHRFDVCIKRISSKYNVICVTFKYPHMNTPEGYGYSCLSSLSLIRSVYVHVFMYACDLVCKRACRVHVYAQMERWIEIGIRSFDTDKHV